MRTFFLFLILLPSLLCAAPRFNPSTVHTYTGTISSIQTFGYITRPTPHKQILLRTLHGEVTVDLGPEWYLEAQGITLFPGEEIVVEGSLIRVNGVYFVIASTLTKGDIMYHLRDKNGRPHWLTQSSHTG